MNKSIYERTSMRTLISIICCLGMISCKSEDPSARLRQLESQRETLTQKIEQLKLEITKNKGNQIGPKAVSVEIEQIESQIFKHFIKIQGTVESDKNILIPPKSSGVVKQIYVKEGDRVSQDQLLAELDGAIYESTIAELETNLELASTIFKRQERLWAKKIGSEIQYLQAKTNKESLEKKLATLREQYKLTKIIAPINGTVDEVLIKEGEAASAGFGAIRIVKLSDLKIDAALSENYISQVRKGDSVEVFFPVLGESFFQTIDAVSQVIDPKNRTFNIEIKVPKSIPDVKPNMLVILTINNYTNLQALTIPVNAVQSTGSEKFLFVAVNKPDLPAQSWMAEQRTIKTGINYNDRVEILEGLNSGENIVVFGFQDLADGQIITTK